MSAEPALRCAGVSVEYPDTKALDRVELTVARGQMVALLGASGSGKSTLLHAVAGLVRLSAGEIRLGDAVVADARRHLPPERRDIGLVFQDFALWPHLTCLETVAYPLRRAGHSRRAAHLAARRLLDDLDIAELAARRPAELSGGQQQRVGLARALARRPGLFLLDEPTAHLDTHLRSAFQDRVREQQGGTGAAAVYATHDATEALALADRVALIVAGRLVQVGLPETVYAEPVDAAAALLTGPCTVLSARVAARCAGTLSVDLGLGPIEAAGGGIDVRAAAPRHVLLRPEWVHLDGPFAARVGECAFRGPHTDYRLDTPAGPVLMRVPGSPCLAVGSEVSWGLRRVWALSEPVVDRAARGGSAQGGDRARVLEPVVDQVEM